MTLDLATPELAQALAAASDDGALDRALGAAEALVGGFRDPAIWGRKLFLPDLDALVPHLAERLGLADRPQAKSNARACIVASQLYAVGGHSRVVEDIAARLGPGEATLVLTDPRRQIDRARLLAARGQPSPYQQRATLLLGAETRVQRIREMYELISAIRPGRIFLLSHHIDTVAAVALWPFRDVVEFVHHADHLPALGAALPWSAHVDVTYACHLHCRKAGLPAVYAGLAAPRPEPSAKSGAPAREGRPLRLATSGSQHKFEGRRTHAWSDYAVAALRRPGTELFHIGPASPAFQTVIGEALRAAGLDAARYAFMGPVPSLSAALLRIEADVYLGSYPEGGGKAAMEAMAARIPTILPQGEGLPPLMRFDLPLRRWIGIARPDELQGALDRALAQRPELRTPTAQAELDRELGRFDDYVAGRPLPETPGSELARVHDEAGPGPG